MRYLPASSPLSPGTLFPDGVTTHEVAALGPRTYHMAPAGRRIPAFVGLAGVTGGYYAENPDGMSVDRALSAARFPTQVQTSDVNSQLIDERGVTQVDYPTLHGTIGIFPDGSKVGLGTVGDRYKILQPGEQAELGQAIIDQSGANIVAAGCYGNPLGSRTYIALKLPAGLSIAGQDPHDLYFTLINSYNGQTSLTVMFAPIRLACTNQTEMTFGRVANRFQIRHSGNIVEKANTARTALQMTADWAASWRTESDRLLRTAMSKTAMESFLEKAMPTPPNVKTANGARRWDTRRTDILDLARYSPTNEFGRGTAYAALNALIEYLDYREVQGTPTPREVVARRGERLLDGRHASTKVKAADLLLGA